MFFQFVPFISRVFPFFSRIFTVFSKEKRILGTFGVLSEARVGTKSGLGAVHRRAGVSSVRRGWQPVTFKTIGPGHTENTSRNKLYTMDLSAVSSCLARQTLAKRRWSLEPSGCHKLVFLICCWMPQCVIPHVHNTPETKN